MSDFDLNKENIQPQRRGHSAAELENLAKVSDPEFQAKVRLEGKIIEFVLLTPVYLWGHFL